MAQMVLNDAGSAGSTEQSLPDLVGDRERDDSLSRAPPIEGCALTDKQTEFAADDLTPGIAW